jgi:hypothetical protein
VDRSAEEHSSDDIARFLATLDRLKQRATGGNEQAMDILWMTGVEAGFCLANIEAHGSPETKQTLQTLTAGRLGWPVVLTCLDGSKEIERLLRSLNLGKGLPYDPESQVRMDQLATLAYELIEHIAEAGDAWRARRNGETPARRAPSQRPPAKDRPQLITAAKPIVES